MISYVLSAFALLLVLYAAREWRHSRLVALLLLMFSAAGMIFVWVPRAASALSSILGVGRPADMVFYIYIALSFLLILNLALKLRGQHQDITRLARRIAINNARQRNDGAKR